MSKVGNEDRVMSEWISVKDKEPSLGEIVLFLQLSTGKYFAGRFEKEEMDDIVVDNKGSSPLMCSFWVTATGSCKDVRDDDVWMSFPLYRAIKEYK